MISDNPVPFYANTPDDTHCFQAALRMLLKYFYPDEDYSWQELDELSAKVKDLWTWPTAGLIWLKHKGLDVRVITPFDYQAFIAEGGDFLISKYGKEVGQAQIEHSDIAQERELAKQLLQAVPIDQNIPTLADIISMVRQGYIVMCNVNSQVLNGRQGYVGHFVLVKGIADQMLVVHDPGLPPLENRLVSFQDFEKAWAYPNEEAKDIYAFKR